jgi:hypothetical protein
MDQTHTPASLTSAETHSQFGHAVQRRHIRAGGYGSGGARRYALIVEGIDIVEGGI